VFQLIQPQDIVASVTPLVVDNNGPPPAASREQQHPAAAASLVAVMETRHLLRRVNNQVGSRAPGK